MLFSGFPRNVHLIPVPSPLFGPLLEQIDDLSELKCTLRLIWLLQQKKGSPKYVTHDELLADCVLGRALPGEGDDLPSKVARAMDLAVGRGIFLSGQVRHRSAGERVYALNTQANRDALADTVPGGELPNQAASKIGPWEGATERPNIFALYEDNIGMISPMIADELKEAEGTYPQTWIEDAIREAVGNNKRSWRYIARILERWEREGRNNGGPGRYSKKVGYQEHRPR